MKKHLIAAAALATLSTAAFAQNVTIYGVMDAGVISSSKSGGTTTDAGKVTSFNNGGTSPSILGFKGTEDLGGGLKANFALEAHLNTSNGATNQWNSALFGRQANVGLSGSFGAIALGKQYTPAVLAFAATDPRGLKEQYSGLMTWALSGGSTTNTSQAIDVFSGNAISYNTSVAGLNLGALYGVGGLAGDTSSNKQLSLGLVYAAPVTVSASYQTQHGSTLGDGKVNSKHAVGFAYTFGPATVKANYLNAKAYNATTGATTSEQEIYGLGVNYALNAKNTLTVAYYDGETKNVANSKARSYILSNDYAFSKRTTLYALVAIADLDSSAAAGSIASQTASGTTPTLYVKGASTTAYGVGIKHSF